jgi:hypothetical protein
MTKYKYFKSVNYRSNVNLVTESDIVEVSDQTSEGGTTPTLQEVTDEGAVTTNAIEVGTRIIVNDAGGDGDEVMKFNYDTDQGEPRFVFENQDGGKFELTFTAPESGTKTLIYSEESGVSAVSKTVNANFTAFNFASYTTIATLTVTDPSPVEGQGYIVFVRNGTTTIDGVGYTSGNLIYRFYQGGAWSSTVFGNSAPISTATQTALDARVEVLVHDTTPVATVGTGLQELKAYTIPANKVTKSLIFPYISLTKTGTASTALIFIRISNTNDFSTATQIARVGVAATNLSAIGDRHFIIDGTTLKGLPFNTGFLSDKGPQLVAKESTTIDFTQTVYVWFAGQVFGTGDTVGVDGIRIIN